MGVQEHRVSRSAKHCVSVVKQNSLVSLHKDIADVFDSTFFKGRTEKLNSHRKNCTGTRVEDVLGDERAIDEVFVARSLVGKNTGSYEQLSQREISIAFWRSEIAVELSPSDTSAEVFRSCTSASESWT